MHNGPRRDKRVVWGVGLAVLLAGCDDSGLAITLRHEDIVVVASPIYYVNGVPLRALDCDFTIAVFASGGDGEAVSEGWDQRVSWRNDWAPQSAADFTSEFGRDRLESGDVLRARFNAERLTGATPQGFEALARFRFRMPDGALETFDLTTPCHP